MRNLLIKLLRKNASHWLVLFIDVTIVCFSFILSYIIRFDTLTHFITNDLIYQLPFISIISACCFWFVGSNRGIIRHTGIQDALNVLIGSSLLSFALLLIVAINLLTKIFPNFTIPKTIIVIHFFITSFTLIFSRFLFKKLYRIITKELGEQTKVLIYGAGDAGIITYGAIKNDTQQNYQVVGFVDDNKGKRKRKINGVRIYSRKHITKKFVKENNIKELIFTISRIKPERFMYLTDKALMVGLKIKIIPPLSKWMDGEFNINQIKQVRIEDLLDREPISIDNPIIKKDVNEKVIIITGAAGSIGSEICRQVCKYNHKQLILIDQAESALYDLQQELIRHKITKFTPIVSDVRDYDMMNRIFKEYKPDKIFHAAAYKHVPLMESNPYEAVKINVQGTKNIADLSLKYGVEKFVMVSTDKAVNPTNVMGATKRVAEMYIGCLAKDEHNTKFITTRFGNVLGSNGSVIPLFKKQIEEGGPLTVTHKEITRFFMTIPEACQLVLEAGSMGNGGEIYIFDMGKSVKIFNIAKKMIHLSGLKYPEDIDIKITGLRPGEKLYEELLANGENTTPTYHNKIMIAKTASINELQIKQLIEDLCISNKTNDNFTIVSKIKEIVPEYISQNSEFSKLDN